MDGFLNTTLGFMTAAYEVAFDWLIDPENWVQFALLVGAYLVAVFIFEFWVNGIDDGRFKYQSHVRFAVWNTLKDAGIEIPFPQRVVEIKGGFPAGVTE
ncbi:hypothetical protein OAN307_c47270 [Octadecabacter antarcticus 307]|uniref:Uncharacterized protein n=1 Tax=Octadecabacter antarcticus 307 TaxID=391626 RepID=M9RE88_9RHOB|nr:hypothetical protein OAN307_c47270 [Octadecabacter antarcticus 307]